MVRPPRLYKRSTLFRFGQSFRFFTIQNGALRIIAPLRFLSVMGIFLLDFSPFTCQFLP